MKRPPQSLAAGAPRAIDPAGLAYDAPPDLLLGWEGDTPHSSLLDAFGRYSWTFV